MESQEVLERVKGAEDSGVGFDQVGDSVKGVENLDVDLLVELDSYLDDIDGRLTISRMVSDAVTKGMVNGFQQEAAEEIAAKEFEVARLKESFCIQHVGNDETGSSQLLAERENIDLSECLNVMDVCVKHDKMSESLQMLRKDATEQFLTLKNEIASIRGGCSLQREGSGSEVVGLSGILKERESGSLVGIDRTVDSLERTLNSICTSVDNMLHLSKVSVYEWKQEENLKGEIEKMVMKSSIRSMQEEFKTKMWDQQACLYDNQTVNWLEKFNEISSLRKELAAFMKLLPTPPDHGQLVSHASIDLDTSHGIAGTYVSPQTPRWEGNGKADGSETSLPENFTVAQLSHLKREELVNYFNTEILKMKREHECEVQKITEKYFYLKGKYLNERGAVLPLTKGKEFDLLRKRVPEVILKLDDILLESEKLPTLGNDVVLGSLRDRLDSLLAENSQLRDSLADKNHEVKCLSSQVSDTHEKMMQYSLVESNSQNLIRNLNLFLEDAHMEGAITEKVYTCVIGEMRDQIICITEESGLQLSLMQDMYEVILREGISGASTSNYEVEDTDIESLIKQELYESILVQTLKDGERKFEELLDRYLLTEQNRASMEVKANEMEDRLRSEVVEKKRLGEELTLMSKILNEKERSVMELSVALTKEKQQVEQVSEELDRLSEHASLQKVLVSKANKEIDTLKGELVETEEQIEAYQLEIRSLNRKIEGLMEQLREAGAQRSMTLALTQEKETWSSLVEAKEKEHMEHIKAMLTLFEGLLEKVANLECRVGSDMERNNLRLENLSSQLRSLIKKANVLREKEFLYKQRLEKRCGDLQMAEAEVDLLGDEVETLLSLLEKIYVALDHYSPVLRHYPGVIEILKLVRRELSEEPVKPV